MEIAIFVAGPTEEQNTLDMISYVDCLESLLADYPETESLYDILTENAEYFSRGSTIEKMARIMVLSAILIRPTDKEEAQWVHQKKLLQKRQSEEWNPK